MDSTVQLISAAFELHVWEIYALENVVFYIAVYEPYKPYISHYVCRAPEINCRGWAVYYVELCMLLLAGIWGIYYSQWTNGLFPTSLYAQRIHCWCWADHFCKLCVLG